MATLLNDRQRSLARSAVALMLLSKKHHQTFQAKVLDELRATAKVSGERFLFSPEECAELITLLARESVVCGPLLGDGETEADSELKEALSSLDSVKGTLKQAGFNAGIPGADVPGETLPGAEKAGG